MVYNIPKSPQITNPLLKSFFHFFLRKVGEHVKLSLTDLKHFFEGIVNHRNVIYNNKYANNYDYNKAIYLMCKEKLYDNDFVLLRESNDLFSPLSMIHFQFYKSKKEIYPTP